MKTTIVAAAVLVFLAGTARAADYEKAVLLQRHGLQAEAKRELIDVIFDKAASDVDKARAYFMLGSIAVDENSITSAVRTWTDLTTRFPESPEAAKAKEVLKSLTDILGDRKTELISDAVARSYLANAEFWSREKHDVFTIDSSWIGNVEAAVKWYDKVLAQFPGTPAAEVAYVGKMRTLLGWEGRGRYDEPEGLKTKDTAAWTRYMEALLSTFSAYEKDFPKSSSAQAFRFQIAQAYWGVKNWDKTQTWLRRIVEVGPEDSFYVDLAKRRLEKLKY